MNDKIDSKEEKRKQKIASLNRFIKGLEQELKGLEAEPKHEDPKIQKLVKDRKIELREKIANHNKVLVEMQAQK